jgi:hypothetical protein
MLEPKTLKRTPVPDPAKVPLAKKRRLLTLLDERLSLSASAAVKIEKQIDELVAELYGLSSHERQAIGMEG